MIPARIENPTRNPGAPEGWDAEKNGDCVALAIRDEVWNGMPVMLSAWTPTPAELARLNAGGNIVLCVVGQVHPPVWLSAGNAPK